MIGIALRLKNFLGTLVSSNDSEPREEVFTADLPIQRATEDLLDRGSFARALGSVIYRYRGFDSFVVALRGDWGSGKTSIKNLVVETLSPAGAPPMKVVTFNAWRWGDDDAITRAFFREIEIALGDKGQSLSARLRAHEFRRYALILERLSGTAKQAGTKLSEQVVLLGGIGLLLAGGVITLDLPAQWLAAVLTVLAGVMLVLSNAIAFFWRDREDDRPLDMARASLEDRLKSLPRNILIVIDDIDRLEPDQIRTVIRHVKANADLPGLSYLLLYQRDVVERAFDAGEPGSGRRYLEKIVQAAFDVPVVEGDRIGRIVLYELEKLTKGLPEDSAFDQTRWGNVWHGGLKHLFRNLRDAKRFIAGVEVQFVLHRGSRVMETNLIDTIALEALRVFAPDVHLALSRNKGMVTGSKDRASGDKDQIKALFGHATKESRESVECIASQLFPVVGWAYGSPWHGSDFESSWATERRICSAAYFDRYFFLRLPEGQIPDSEFLDFISGTADRRHIDEVVSRMSARGLLPELIDRLDQAAVGGKLPLENMDTLLPAIFDIAEPLPHEFGFSSRMPFISCWRAALWYLRSEPNQGERRAAFERAVSVADGLAVPGTLIGLDIDRRKKGEGENLFDDDQLAASKSAWVSKLVTLLQNESEKVIRGHHLIDYLYRWQEFDGIDGPAAWFAKTTADPKLLPLLLRVFVHQGQAHAMGDYVTHKVVSFRLDAMLPFADVCEVLAFVRSLPSQSDPTLKDACERFIEAAERHLAQPDDA
ncbi:hypothetical protein RPPS3_40220 [Rhodopseudomonas palustris]|uniref:KAP family P-loop NTPase fold protein n=1 Tax=Rhodopseudomonas palustris TaxID=1076 RepID=UPI000D22955B|nr:P-loop NTPase fold protein [Rhodopseudomonas palustris]AVT78084.1 hypothetical protein RPPS3_40220 [Rhodopseudomonas palustris]